MKILTEATPLALWYEAIHEAQIDSQIALNTDLESYLVYLLMRNMNNRNFAREILAYQFLQGLNRPPQQKGLILQTVGDHCLLISGLFPALAEKRRVKLRYYIELGQLAYGVISQKNNDLFSSLAKQFVPLMDVLQSFRPYVAPRIHAWLSFEGNPPSKKE